MYDFLRMVPLFADLSEADLERLCQMIDEVRLAAGQTLFREGSLGDRAYVIQEGEVEIIKASGKREILLAVRRSGEVIGEMSIIEEAPRNATVRARSDSLLLAISQAQLNELLNTSPSAARAMLNTVIGRWRSMEGLLRQSEQLAQLGTLTAGVAHELNNPAAAVQRGAGQLQGAVARLQESVVPLNRLALTEAQIQQLQALDSRAQAYAGRMLDLDPVARSDRECELQEWLEERGLENGWEIAPVLVQMGLEAAGAEEGLRPAVFGPALPLVMSWLAATFTVYDLLAEVGHGAGRIAEIVKSLKSYSYLDQAPVQNVDVHEGLDNTLVMLRSRLKGGITVRREYAPDVPKIVAYGSELNQVWTNMIANAAEAMNGQGELTLRTRREGEFVVVEIEDNGPGIPEGILPKIFDPFFTTKLPGQGTGLGLNISYNIVVHKHRGQINVYSRPGKTCFRVTLPVNFEAVGGSGGAADTPLAAFPMPDDATLRDILTTAKTVAVVGISGREDRPAHTVPAYLQRHGYRIIPVNPNLVEVLGERAYGELAAVPEAVDVVQIFRPGEAVPPVVEQAIDIGARVVWMQEGVVNEAAGQRARDAGLQVVMDTCMRTQHQRLIRDEG